MTMETSQTQIKKVLIANRGEIAVRVIRACRELGIATVAVYSDADRTSLHVRYADEAIHIGPPSPRESYLKIDKILEAAKRSGADAIHPGYGFLSEREDFAQAVLDEGLIFIGPPPEAIAMMGDKQVARETVKKAGVPVVPGTEPGLRDDELFAIADQIGFPIMVKAAAGGGGKGMRAVESAEELPECAGNRAARSRKRLWRWARLSRKADRRRAPHRVPDSRRHARQHDSPRRARMLDPAPPSEAGRRIAQPVRRSRSAPAHGRDGGQGGASLRLRQRRDD